MINLKFPLLVMQLVAVGRQQAMRAQQRVELSHRASTEVCPHFT